MANEDVTLKELASALGLERSNARKWLLLQSEKLGIHSRRARTRSSNGQEALVWTASDAVMLVKRREELGFSVGGVPTPQVPSNGNGVFYLIRLAPDLAPGRIKGGWADNIAQRIRDHRCAAPTCELVREWPCRKVWEAAALAVVASVARQKLSTEVFDVADIDAVCTRLDMLFGLLAPTEGS